MSEKRTIQTKLSEIQGRKSNWAKVSVKKFPKLWVYPLEVAYFPEIPEN